jgi:hypothetical protein
VEHGLFLDMATAVIIAGKTGVEVKSKWGFLIFMLFDALLHWHWCCSLFSLRWIWALGTLSWMILLLCSLV